MRLRRTTGVGPKPSAPQLIGIDDLKTPSWAQVMETVAGTGIGRTLRAAPTALRVLVRLAWQTSPRLTLLAAAVELVAGCAMAFGLLATAGNGDSSGASRTTVLITHRLANIRHAD